MFPISVLVVLLIVALVIVLVSGIFLMGVGGKANNKYANKLMIARVCLQGLIVIGLILMFFAGNIGK